MIFSDEQVIEILAWGNLVMPEKKDPYSTPAMKALGLYCLLLFSRKKYSYTELARNLRCSKQSVGRYLEEMERVRGTRIETWTEGREKFFRVKPPRGAFNVTLNPDDIHNLLLCRDFVWHLLPDTLRNEISNAIRHTTALLPLDAELDAIPERSAQTRPKGAIDYSAKRDIFQTLLAAMRDHKVCRVQYARPGQEAPVVHFVAPIRFMLSGECLYVPAWYLWEDRDPPDPFKLTLALHRVISAQTMDRTFLKQDSLDEPSACFGIMDGEPFPVRVAFRPGAAVYVSERTWSQGQTLVPQPDGGVILTFTATSRPEVLSWVLSFGTEAELLEPEDLRAELAGAVRDLAVLYGAEPTIPGGD